MKLTANYTRSGTPGRLRYVIARKVKGPVSGKVVSIRIKSENKEPVPGAGMPVMTGIPVIPGMPVIQHRPVNPKLSVSPAHSVNRSHYCQLSVGNSKI